MIGRFKQGLSMNEGRRASTIVFGLFASVAGASGLRADDAFSWSGFALVRGATKAANPFESDRFSAQIQAGIDWAPAPTLLCHLHLLARTDDGNAGTPEAYVEANLHPGDSRVRLRAGAFFLPTSRENVDALWENPYAISSSALNTWMSESRWGLRSGVPSEC